MRRNRFRFPLGLLAAVVAVGAAGCAGGDTPAEAGAPRLGPPRVQVLETPPLRIDAIYRSMQGPFGVAEVDIGDLDWVTAYKTQVVDADSGANMGGEFFCHSMIMQTNTYRLFMNASGTEEIRLPPGFAVPVSQILSGLPEAERRLGMLGMVLNNHVPDIDRLARVRVTLEYYANEDLPSPPPFKKLYNTSLPMQVKDLEAYDPSVDGPVNDDVTTHCVLVKGLQAHWMVPPGPQMTRNRYRDFLPVDGTVHFALVHMHNYGVYMKLTDVTTGEELWKAEVDYEPDRKQIRSIPVYSSRQGFPILRDHVYEIEAYYDNTTDRPVDAMAMLNLYYHPAGDENIIYPQAPNVEPL